MPYFNIARGTGSRRLELSIASMTPGFNDTSNTDDTDQDFTTTGGNADNEWMARKFTAVNTGKVQYAKLELAKTDAALAGTIAACIYSDDGGGTSMPSTQIGNASNTITNTALTASPGTTEEFIWGLQEGQEADGPDIVAGTVYWLVLKTVGYTYTNGVDEVIWRTDANGAVGLNECAKYDANAGTPWTTMGADVGADLVIGSSANFEITSDVDSDALPNEMEIVGVTITPSVATVYEANLFNKSTRLRADTEWTKLWYSGEAASRNPYQDPQPYRYHDRDVSSKVMGSIRIHPDEADSAFEIAISYV